MNFKRSVKQPARSSTDLLESDSEDDSSESEEDDLDIIFNKKATSKLENLSSEKKKELFEQSFSNYGHIIKKIQINSLFDFKPPSNA